VFEPTGSRRDAASVIFNLLAYRIIDAIDLPLGGRRVKVHSRRLGVIKRFDSHPRLFTPRTTADPSNQVLKYDIRSAAGDAGVVRLLNAAHMKAVLGCKSDLSDADWIALSLEHGLLRRR
jgi:hypothetical protein